MLEGVLAGKQLNEVQLVLGLVDQKCFLKRKKLLCASSYVVQARWIFLRGAWNSTLRR